MKAQFSIWSSLFGHTDSLLLQLFNLCFRHVYSCKLGSLGKAQECKYEDSRLGGAPIWSLVHIHEEVMAMYMNTRNMQTQMSKPSNTDVTAASVRYKTILQITWFMYKQASSRSLSLRQVFCCCQGTGVCVLTPLYPKWLNNQLMWKLYHIPPQKIHFEVYLMLFTLIILFRLLIMYQEWSTNRTARLVIPGWKMYTVSMSDTCADGKTSAPERPSLLQISWSLWVEQNNTIAG